MRLGSPTNSDHGTSDPARQRHVRRAHVCAVRACCRAIGRSCQVGIWRDSAHRHCSLAGAGHAKIQHLHEVPVGSVTVASPPAGPHPDRVLAMIAGDGTPPASSMCQTISALSHSRPNVPRSTRSKTSGSSQQTPILILIDAALSFCLSRGIVRSIKTGVSKLEKLIGPDDLIDDEHRRQPHREIRALAPPLRLHFRTIPPERGQLGTLSDMRWTAPMNSGCLRHEIGGEAAT